MTPTSVGGGHSKPAASNASPSAGKALGEPALSFGARLNNVPAPISTLGLNPGDIQAHGDRIDASHEGRTQQQLQMRQLPRTYGVFGPPRMPNAGGLCNPSDGGQPPQPHQTARLPPLSNLLGDVSKTQQDTHVQPSRLNNRPINPYAQRAEEIGLRQRLPGAGDIDDLLTPPNWRPGQDPINEVEAQELFHRARALAKQGADDFGGLIQNAPDREERLEAYQRHWHAQRRMDESILFERRQIHKAFLQYRREQAEPTNGGRKQSKQETSYPELSQRLPAGAQPLPMHGSLPMYNGVQQTHRPLSLWNHNDTASPSMGSYHLHQHLQSMEGLHLPGSSPLSPSFLDPRLVPQTYEAALHYYQQNKMLLNQYNFENEQYLAIWSAKYNRQVPHSSLDSPYMGPNIALGGRPFPPAHYGPSPLGHVQTSQPPMVYDPAFQYQLRTTPRPTSVSTPGPMPGPMPGFFPRQMMPGPFPVDGHSDYGHIAHTQPRNGRAAARGQSSLREVQNARSPPKSRHRNPKSREAASLDPEYHEANTNNATTARPSTSKSNKAVRETGNHPLTAVGDNHIQEGPKNYQFVGPEVKPGREKKSDRGANMTKVRLQDDISTAKLPTPTISDQALRAAGVEPKPKPVTQLSETTDSLSKPKGRSRKAAFPAGGIRVSGSFGSALLAAGSKATRQRLPASASATPCGVRSGLAPSPDETKAAPVPKATKNIIDLTHGHDDATSSQPPGPDKRPSLTVAEGDDSDHHVADHSDESSSSSDDASSASPSSVNSLEDPNDGGYGKRATSGGRNATTTRKESGKPRKTPVVPAKRRPSIAAAHGSADKRSRRDR